MERLKTALANYYQMVKQADEIQKKIDQIQYVMDGVGGIAYDTIKAGNVDREEKLIRLIEKKEPYEEVLDHLYMAMALLRVELRLDTLTEEEETILRYVFLERLAYDTIAKRMNYAGKVAIYRKVKGILRKLEDE